MKATRAFVSLAVAVLLATCAEPSRSPPSADGLQAEARDPEFVLSIATRKAVWAENEPIDARATLRYVGADGGTRFWTSGHGALVFSLREVGGTRLFDGVRSSDCVGFRIDAGQPLVSPYVKSGAVNPGEPNAFYKAFFADPLFRLPRGQWEITAWASLVLPPGCGEGRRVDLRASITFTVR